MVASRNLWVADQDVEIIVYCGSRHRSTIAMEMLLSCGASNITSLSGGIGGWVGAGYPSLKMQFPNQELKSVVTEIGFNFLKPVFLAQAWV